MTGVTWEEKIGGKLSPARFLPLLNKVASARRETRFKRNASRFLIIFAVVLFIKLFKIKIILTSESVSQILKCS